MNVAFKCYNENPRTYNSIAIDSLARVPSIQYAGWNLGGTVYSRGCGKRSMRTISCVLVSFPEQ